MKTYFSQQNFDYPIHQGTNQISSNSMNNSLLQSPSSTFTHEQVREDMFCLIDNLYFTYLVKYSIFSIYTICKYTKQYNRSNIDI